jgi:hypothetical protein
LINIYAENAVLVIKPGMKAVGKDQIKNAFEAIAAHFEHSLDVKQAGMLDDLKRSTAVFKLARWKRNGILSGEDLKELTEETQKHIESICNFGR